MSAYRSKHGFTISDLKAALKGGSQSNKYRVTIPLLSKLQNSLYPDARKLSILCKEAMLGAKNIQPAELWHYGRRYTIRSEMQYDSLLSLTFYDDNTLSLRRLFDHWFFLVDNATQATASFLGTSLIANNLSYKTNIEVSALNGEGQEIYGYLYTEAFPSTIDASTLSADATDQIIEFNVMFQYMEMLPLQK